MCDLSSSGLSRTSSTNSLNKEDSTDGVGVPFGAREVSSLVASDTAEAFTKGGESPTSEKFPATLAAAPAAAPVAAPVAAPAQVSTAAETTAAVSFTTGDGHPAVQSASSEGMSATSETLRNVSRSEDADSNFADENGQTAMHIAAGNEGIGEIERLINAGSDPNIENANKQTPLHIAAANGSLSILDILIESGADINATDNQGLTALHYAVEGGHIEAVRVLLKATQDLTSSVLNLNKDVFIKIVSKDGMMLQYASEILKGDPDVVKAAVKQNPAALQYASEDQVLGILREDGLKLQHAGDFRSDEYTVLWAVYKNGLALQFASENLKDDEDIVRTAVEQKPAALQFASKNKVIDIVGQEPLNLQYASAEMKADPEVVQAAVEKDGLALEHVSTDCEGYRDIVLAAVGQNGLALKHASAEMKADPEVVETAVGKDGLALEHVSTDCEGYRDIVLAAVEKDGLALQYAEGRLKADLAVVKAAVEKDGLALEHVSTDCERYRDIVLAAVGQNGLALIYASEEMKADPAVVKAAVEKNGFALTLASVSEECAEYRDIVLAAVGQDGLALIYASPNLKSDLEIRKVAYQSITRNKAGSRSVSGVPKLPGLNIDALVTDFSKETLSSTIRKQFESFTEIAMQNFMEQSLTFLDLSDSRQELFSITWLTTMQTLMNLEGEQKEVFAAFVNLATGMSINRSEAFKLTSEALVDQLWEGASGEYLCSPNTPGHFLYVHAKKTQKDEVVFTVGNTGQGVQGLDATSPTRKANLLRRYTVKKRENKSDESFKDRIFKMTKQLQTSQNSKGQEQCDANVFMTEILSDVFKGISAESLTKRKVQSVGNCAMKGLTKNLLYQVCLGMKPPRPDLYYEITDKMSEVLLDVFRGEGEDLEKVRGRITKKREKLAKKNQVTKT